MDISILRLRDVLPEYLVITRALGKFLTPALVPGFRQYEAFISELYDCIVVDIDGYRVGKTAVFSKSPKISIVRSPRCRQYKV